MSVKVCQMTSVHTPRDVRIFYKECKSLARAGYETVLIAMVPEAAEEDGVKLVPFPVYKSRLKRLLFSPFKMFSLAMKEQAAVYHFHDPELLITGLLLRLCGRKVIYDAHEDYSRQIRDKYWIRSAAARRAVAWIYHSIEWVMARVFMSAVVAVTDDTAAQFPPSKTVRVRNFVDQNMIASAAPPTLEKKKPVIIHVGGLYRHKGVLETIQAVGLLEGRAELWLAGKWGEPGYEEACRRENGWQYTKYLGFLKPEAVYSYLKTADIGISTQHPVGNFLTALPVKFFEYMACSLPMVISDFPYWRELFHGGALFADPFNPKDIAAGLKYLLDHPPEAREMGQKGLQMVNEGYNWRNEEKVLLGLYERLTGKKHENTPG